MKCMKLVSGFTAVLLTVGGCTRSATIAETTAESSGAAGVNLVTDSLAGSTTMDSGTTPGDTLTGGARNGGLIGSGH
jgi:hypothetical protein